MNHTTRSVEHVAQNMEHITHNKGNTSPCSKPRGFTLLIAVLVSGVMLALGFAIFNIVSKEVILSSTGRESQFAFYSADSGIECALYWDLEQNTFVFNSEVNAILCGGGPVSLVKNDGGAYISPTAKSQFSFYLNGAGTGQCATVTVYKTAIVTVETDGTTTGLSTTTKIESLGYNTCDTGNPKRLERGIQAKY